MAKKLLNNKDKCNGLKGKFSSNPFASFGYFLKEMSIVNIKFHADSTIKFTHPVTAICGFNGVGKSTIIQLASIAYQNSLQDESLSSIKYISDVLKKSNLDSDPFSDKSSVRFKYIKENNIEQILTITKRSDGGWSDQTARPERRVYYPKNHIERKNITSNSDEIFIESEQTENVSEESQKWINKILSRAYKINEVHTGKIDGLSTYLFSANYNNKSYSEINMGDGESKVQDLIYCIESLPEKSLILLEEPEIFLHPLAQYNFGCYLIDVVYRNNHQIIITSHSLSLLNALPRDSIKYLKEETDNTGIKFIKVIDNLTANQVNSFLSDGYNKALHIFVEDEKYIVAKVIVEEIVRIIDPDFLDNILVESMGSCDNVKLFTKKMNQLKTIKCVGILDADQNSSPKDNIYVLPSLGLDKTSPEVDIFSSEEIQNKISQDYNIDFINYQSTYLYGVDHHEWFGKLSNKFHVDEESLRREICRLYVKQLPENVLSTFVQQLKEACL